MGSICRVLTESPLQPNQHSTKICSTKNQQKNTKINQIKQFLTLTSKNTQSCFNSRTQYQTHNPDQFKLNKNIQNFTLIRTLGQGAFGQVCLVKDKDKNQYYAMKIINKTKIKNIKQQIYVFSQRYILQSVDHPFVVKLHYAFQTKNKLYLIVDLMPGGQLFYLLRKQKKFTQQIAKFYAAEILLGLQYLHSKNIIYRDLKPENILLDKEGHLKLTDFGLSKVVIKNQLAYSICGTPQYIAPQVVSGKGYNKVADWFSFGSLLYDMLTGAPPFYSKNKHQILRKISTKRVPIPEYLSEDAKSLLTNLLKIKPSQRLGFHQGAQQIKQHKFFQQINFNLILKKQIKPPITFVQTQINKQGFDQCLEQINGTPFSDQTYKGFGFDGFTYYIHEISSPTKDEISDPNEHIQLIIN